MALPSSGSISLNQVNVELGNSGTATINMGSSAVRGLFDRSSGSISMSDGHGKSNVSYTSATGGTVTTSGNYKIHTFTGSGTFTVSTLGDGSFETLVVAGAGAGGNGGGGGAGGYLTNAGLTMAQSSYSITVGAGGAYSNQGNDGTSSVISGSGITTITAAGGGGGGGTNGSGVHGRSGGSGGGGGVDVYNGILGNGGAASPAGQGNAGASGYSDEYYDPDYDGGGGGGAGGAPTGGRGQTNSFGGVGLSSSITGTAVTRASGGDGRIETANPDTVHVAGGNNTGDGGSHIRAGGSGIVIIRYQFQ